MRFLVFFLWLLLTTSLWAAPLYGPESPFTKTIKGSTNAAAWRDVLGAASATNLNADSLTSGTIPLARLPSSVTNPVPTWSANATNAILAGAVSGILTNPVPAANLIGTFDNIAASNVNVTNPTFPSVVFNTIDGSGDIGYRTNYGLTLHSTNGVAFQADQHIFTPASGDISEGMDIDFPIGGIEYLFHPNVTDVTFVPASSNNVSFTFFGRVASTNFSGTFTGNGSGLTDVPMVFAGNNTNAADFILYSPGGTNYVRQTSDGVGINATPVAFYKLTVGGPVQFNSAKFYSDGTDTRVSGQNFRVISGTATKFSVGYSSGDVAASGTVIASNGVTAAGGSFTGNGAGLTDINPAGLPYLLQNSGTSNLLTGATWITGAGWTNNGNGSFSTTTNGSSGYENFQAYLPNMAGLFMLEFDYVAKSNYVQCYLGSNGSGTCAVSFLGPSTTSAGLVAGQRAYGLGVFATGASSTNLIIRYGNGFVGTISNLVLVRVR